MISIDVYTFSCIILAITYHAYVNISGYIHSYYYDNLTNSKQTNISRKPTLSKQRSQA